MKKTHIHKARIWNFSKSWHNSKDIKDLLKSINYDKKDIKQLDVEELKNIGDQYKLCYIDKKLELHCPPLQKNHLKTAVVAFMGHVDHGKTSLLEAISKTNLLKKEYGGITQNIAAFTTTYNNREFSFIDTPGHKSFSDMRRLVNDVTDTVVLVIAIDSGVCEQTIESIQHIMNFKKRCVVAVTKTDLCPENERRDRINSIKYDLARYGIVTEDQGGDAILVPVCYKNPKDIELIIDALILQCDLDDKCSLDAIPLGIILDSKSINSGLLVRFILSQGQLHIKDKVFNGHTNGSVRCLYDSFMRPVKLAVPGKPYYLLGMKEVSRYTNQLYSTGRGSMPKELSKLDFNIEEHKHITQKLSGDNFKNLACSNEDAIITTLNVFLKASDYNTLDALYNEISNYEVLDLCSAYVKLNIIRSTVGPVSQHEIIFMRDSKCLAVGFQNDITHLAKSGIPFIYDNNIYKLIDLLSEHIVQNYKKGDSMNLAKVVDVFYLKASDTYIAGCYIESGVFKVNNLVNVFRNRKKILTRALILSIKLKKNNLEEAHAGSHYGLLIKNLVPQKGDEIKTIES